MTKKHFVKLADELKRHYPNQALSVNSTSQEHVAIHAKHDMWIELRDMLADFCQSQNAQFNRDRWLGYINGTNGPSGGKL